MGKFTLTDKNGNQLLSLEQTAMAIAVHMILLKKILKSLNE